MTQHVAHRASDRIAELEGLIAKYQEEMNLIEQLAGKALGYPWFKDDQKNFPGATEADGVCIGEHVAYTIVKQLAQAYTLSKDIGRGLVKKIIDGEDL